MKILRTLLFCLIAIILGKIAFYYFEVNCYDCIHDKHIVTKYSYYSTSKNDTIHSKYYIPTLTKIYLSGQDTCSNIVDRIVWRYMDDLELSACEKLSFYMYVANKGKPRYIYDWIDSFFEGIDFYYNKDDNKHLQEYVFFFREKYLRMWASLGSKVAKNDLEELYKKYNYEKNNKN